MKEIKENVSNLIEKNCARCGKRFIAAPFHMYLINDKWYCSWTCYNHRHDDVKGATDERN